jgi:hypothetical protein
MTELKDEQENIVYEYGHEWIKKAFPTKNVTSEFSFFTCQNCNAGFFHFYKACPSLANAMKISGLRDCNTNKQSTTNNKSNKSNTIIETKITSEK